MYDRVQDLLDVIERQAPPDLEAASRIARGVEADFAWANIKLEIAKRKERVLRQALDILSAEGNYDSDGSWQGPTVKVMNVARVALDRADAFDKR